MIHKHLSHIHNKQHLLCTSGHFHAVCNSQSKYMKTKGPVFSETWCIYFHQCCCCWCYIIIIVYYAEAAENIKHTHTIHAYTTKQFKHTNKNTYCVKSVR